MKVALRVINALVVCAGISWLIAADINEKPKKFGNIGHDRHQYAKNPPHPKVEATPERFVTNREGAKLSLPTEDEAFTFAVFGDRTGGPATGVSILADAVRDVNLIEPDLVMTVGDMIDGYNEADQWLEQMTEFKGIMDKLICPWFPVAGNHDVYWRMKTKGAKKPDREHEGRYETHFGPLWYAFEHKNCWFIVLYSDEGNPETNERNFRKPDCQKMSPEQLAWLGETLEKAKDADHIFAFLHHPRWVGGNYGDDWKKVHTKLVAAGNVKAVFGGHIHHMRYDLKDGIEYVTLATTGGGQSNAIPDVGYLHHYNLVTVRKKQVAMATVPVGEVMDPREMTPELIAQAHKLRKMPIVIDHPEEGVVNLTIENPVLRPIEVHVTLGSQDSRWVFKPDHFHQKIAANEKVTLQLGVTYDGDKSKAQKPAMARVSIDYLGKAFRYNIPPRQIKLSKD